MTPDAPVAVRVDRLSKRYRLGTRVQREIWALREVSFAVERGRILGIIGPNGAGKTTLLKVLARVTPPTTGRVTGAGRVVPLLALGSGFQPDLSGRENVFLNAAMYGIPREEVGRRLDDILEFSGIADFIDVPVRRYSSGMFLRLAFSVAINMSPDILLADEVLAVGDIDFQERCLERVQDAGRAGMAVLFVSHDMAAITRLCQRVLWLNAGEVVKYGAPDEVVAEYQQSAWTTLAKRSRSGAHANEDGEIVFVKLLSAEGRELGATRVADETVVQIGLRVHRRDLRFRAIVDLFARGMAAFRSVQPDETTVDEGGVFVVTVRLPPHLLAETVYSANVIVKLAAADGRESSLTWYHAVAFPVYGVVAGPSARGSYKAELSGVVAPRLHWDVARVDQPARQEQEGAAQ